MTKFNSDRNMETNIIRLIKASLGERCQDLEMADNFIRNGGDSFKAISLAAACRDQGLNVTRAMILTCSSLSDLVSQASNSPESSLVPQSPSSLVRSTGTSITSHKASLGSQLSGTSTPFTTPGTSPTRSTFSTSSKTATKAPRPQLQTPTLYSDSSDSTSALDASESPLTEMQLSMVHGTLASGNANMIVYSETFYTENIPAIKAAWARVIGSESVFQGYWFHEFSQGGAEAFNWEDEATANVSGEASTSLASKYVGRTGSFFEVFPSGIAKNGQRLSTITWTVHHAFIDGYSSQLVFDKVRRLSNGLDAQPGPSFWEWVHRLKDYQRQRKFEGQEFWDRKHSDHAEAKGEILLPTPEKPDDAASTTSIVQIDTKDLGIDVVSAARSIGVTPAVAFYAAWALVFSTYADAKDVVFGAVLSGRNLPIPGSMDVVGPAINVLPLHVALEMNMSARDFMRTLFDNILELEDYSWTTPDDGFSRQYYDSALSVQASTSVCDTQENYAIQPLKTSTTWLPEVPLSVVVEQMSKVKFQYRKDRFSHVNIERIAESYSITLRLLLQSHLTVGAVIEGHLSASAHRTLMSFGNCFSSLTHKTSIKEDLVTLFERNIRSHPENVAVESGTSQLTYKDMDIVTSEVAHKLREIINPGDVVCVHSDKSINWIVAIFGILRAGGVYCSIDSALPSKLREKMYGLAGAKAFITPADGQLYLSPSQCGSTLSVETIRQGLSINFDPRIAHRKVPQPWAAAYICFTSGSTGTPKGVVCTHEGLVAFESDLQVRLHAAPGVRVSQIMSVAFDGSIHEIFSSLTHGATLVLPDGGDTLGPLDSVDSALLTPSIARMLRPEDYPKLKWVYVVGEPVPQTVNDTWASQKELFNMYGPTEATCGATIKRLRPNEPVAIGAPNPTTRIYILNSEKSLCHPGMIGEIYLAGVQVSKGYLNLPDQTNERFSPDSVMRNLEMMYQTGDRGYWNEAGEVVCLGRNDRQIKLRGYRLDMNDLEIRVTRAVPSLEGVAIAKHGDELVAMVQPANIDVVDLRSQLSSVLAHYAMPHHFIAVDKIPMTKAGKIDYKAVIEYEVVSMSSGQNDASLDTPMENLVASAFRTVLGLSDDTRISSCSHFASLGGNSLAQIRLASHLAKKLRVQVPLPLVITRPTVRDLAVEVAKLLETSPATELSKNTLGSEAVSPIEEEWLEKYNLGRGSACFNVSFAAEFCEGTVDADRLTHAWNQVLRRHKLLSSRYKLRSRGRHSKPKRVYAVSPPRVDRVTDLDLWVEVNRPFDLSKEPPIRVMLSRNQMLVLMSHIAADYTTMSVLLGEVSSLYSQKELRPITRTYSDVSVWYEPSPDFHKQFWQDRLGDYIDHTPAASMNFLSKARDIADEGSGHSGKSVFYMFDAAATKKIVQYSTSTGITFQQMALGAVALCLDQGCLEKTDIVIGIPYMNRRSEEDAETVGLFLEPLPIRVRHGQLSESESEIERRGQDKEFSEDSKSTSFMSTVQRSVQSAVAHAMPWRQLLETLSVTPDYPDHPIFDVMVTFHDTDMVESLAMPDLPQLRSQYLWSQGSKFKLMAEFSRISTPRKGDEKLLLRIEYDDGCVSSEEIESLLKMIPQSMVAVAEGLKSSEIKVKLRSVRRAADEDTSGAPVNAERMFGAKLRDF